MSLRHLNTTNEIIYFGHIIISRACDSCDSDRLVFGASPPHRNNHLLVTNYYYILIFDVLCGHENEKPRRDREHTQVCGAAPHLWYDYTFFMFYDDLNRPISIILMNIIANRIHARHTHSYRDAATEEKYETIYSFLFFFCYGWTMVCECERTIESVLTRIIHAIIREFFSSLPHSVFWGEQVEMIEIVGARAKREWKNHGQSQSKRMVFSSKDEVTFLMARCSI